LCLPGLERSSQRRRELVHLDLVRVELRRIDARVAEEGAQRSNVAAAFSEEPVCEAVAQSMRGKRSDAGAPTNALHDSQQRLVAGRQLRILPLPLPLDLRYPLLHFDREHVIVELRLQQPELWRSLSMTSGASGTGCQFVPLSKDADAAPDQVYVCPPYAQNLDPTQPPTFHQQDRGKLVRK
jgi:hypothetical protein